MKYKLAVLTLALSSQAMAIQVYPEFNQVGVNTECSQQNVMKFDLYNDSKNSWKYIIKAEKYFEKNKKETNDLILSSQVIRLKPGQHFSLEVKSNAVLKPYQQMYGLKIVAQDPKIISNVIETLSQEDIDRITKKMQEDNLRQFEDEIHENVILNSEEKIIPIFIDGLDKPKNEIEYVRLGNRYNTLIYNKGTGVLFIPSDDYLYKQNYYILPGETYVTNDNLLAYKIIQIGENNTKPNLGCPIVKNEEIKPLLNTYSNKTFSHSLNSNKQMSLNFNWLNI